MIEPSAAVSPRFPSPRPWVHCAPFRTDRYSCSVRDATPFLAFDPRRSGLFNPQDPQALRAVVDDCLVQAVRPDRVLNATGGALLCAHLSLSLDRTARWLCLLWARCRFGLQRASGCRAWIDRVVLIGPSHFVRFSGLAVSQADGFQDANWAPFRSTRPRAVKFACPQRSWQRMRRMRMAQPRGALPFSGVL